MLACAVSALSFNAPQVPQVAHGLSAGQAGGATSTARADAGVTPEPRLRVAHAVARAPVPVAQYRRPDRPDRPRGGRFDEFILMRDGVGGQLEAEPQGLMSRPQAHGAMPHRQRGPPRNEPMGRDPTGRGPM